MVYINFPANFTEEELMLQAKYQKLKKKVRSMPWSKCKCTKQPVFYRKRLFMRCGYVNEPL